MLVKKAIYKHKSYKETKMVKKAIYKHKSYKETKFFFIIIIPTNKFNVQFMWQLCSGFIHTRLS